jgi:serine/threonine protein kinase
MKTLNDSPRIIRVFGCCELPAKQQLMLLMERAVGGTVAALLEDKRRPLSEQQKGLIIYETSLGMKYLHSKGVMHRDLKSVNLLLNEKGRVKVVCLLIGLLLLSYCTHTLLYSYWVKVSDFGVSVAKCTHTSTKTSTTSAGTTPWMAPEQLAVPPAAFTEACDVYSLGIVMGEVLTRNTTPYPGLQDVQVYIVDSGRRGGRKEERSGAERRH